MKKTSAALDANCERSADAIGAAVSQKLLATLARLSTQPAQMPLEA